MFCELATAEAPSIRGEIRELAERTTDGTMMWLLWLQGTREVWVEIYEPELDITIEIPVEPEHALEAFNDPYAYAAAHNALAPTSEPLTGS
jgi:hypothetical protein